MTTPPQVTLDEVNDLVATMRALGLLVAEDKTATAHRLVSGGMRRDDLVALVSWANQRSSLTDPAGFVSAKLLDRSVAPGSLVADIRALTAKLASNATRRVQRDAGPSEQRTPNVATSELSEPENPYGWAPRSAEVMQRAESDHDEPGKWNEFRQTHNLTDEERRARRLGDHRVRGCSRWAALGDATHPHQQDQSAVWDQTQVDLADETFGPQTRSATPAAPLTPDVVGRIFGE